MPYLTLLDADGKVLANHETGSFEIKADSGTLTIPRSWSSSDYQAKYLVAADVRAAALARGRGQARLRALRRAVVSWCHKLGPGWPER